MTDRRLTGVLRHRDFALLWTGQTVSVAGDGIFTVALALETLRIDDRPSALSLVLAARLVPTVLLLLVGGVVVDRVPRRLAMLTSDVVRGGAVATVALLVAERSITLTGLVLMSVVFGIADAFFSPASTALLPELLPPDLLVQGNAMSSLSRVFAQQLVGPALGGLIVAAAGTAWSFGLDAASFGVSAVCLTAMRTRPRPEPSGRSALADIAEGLRYCRSQPWLWATIAAAGLANFAVFSPLGVLIPLLVRHVLHQSARILGLTLAAGGAGGVATSLTLGRRGLPRRPVLSMWIGWTIAGLAAGSIALAPDIWVLAPLTAVTFAGLTYGNTLWNPLLQRLVPRELLGRASSVDWLFSLGMSPLGIVAAGVLAGLVGTRATLLGGGGVAALAGLCLLVPGVRDPDALSEHDRVR